MNQTYINELKNHIGEEVTLKGWLYNSRSSGKLVFLQLRDGTGIVQCVVFKPNNEELFENAKSLGQESSIIVTGTVKEDTRSAIGVELDVTGFGSYSKRQRISDHAEGTRHGIFDGQSPSVDSFEKTARRFESSSHGHQSRARFF